MVGHRSAAKRRRTKFYTGQLLLLASVILGLDRWTKLAAVRYLSSQNYLLFPGLKLELAYNHGVSWGMFSASGLGTRCFLSGLIFAALGWLCWHSYYRLKQRHRIWGELLVLAGALGNLWDRWLCGAVIDFIAVYWRNWYFPVFNLADVAIFMGVLVMLYDLLRE